jgi:hypothetical protein
MRAQVKRAHASRELSPSSGKRREIKKVRIETPVDEGFACLLFLRIDGHTHEM